MLKRRDKDLIAGAFGEARQDFDSLPEADLERYSYFSSLHQDLKALRSVPGHQLSNERLRDAILKQGLREKKEMVERSDHSWLTPILGVCAAAAMFVIGSHLRHPAVTPVMDKSMDESLALNSLPKMDFSFPKLGGIAIPEVEASTRSVPSSSRLRLETIGVRARIGHHQNVVSVANRSHESRSKTLDPSWLTFSASSQQPGSELSPSPLAVNSAVDSNPSIAPSVPLSDVGSSPESKAIVEIDQTRDQETGARSAKEVESRNVVVGG